MRQVALWGWLVICVESCFNCGTFTHKKMELIEVHAEKHKIWNALGFELDLPCSRRLCGRRTCKL